MHAEPGLDLCQSCKQQLPKEMDNLLPLRNVATKRKDRISSDEEERLRLGYGDGSESASFPIPAQPYTPPPEGEPQRPKGSQKHKAGGRNHTP